MPNPVRRTACRTFTPEDGDLIVSWIHDGEECAIEVRG
jgi:hypothetical protein